MSKSSKIDIAVEMDQVVQISRFNTQLSILLDLHYKESLHFISLAEMTEITQISKRAKFPEIVEIIEMVWQTDVKQRLMNKHK